MRQTVHGIGILWAVSAGGLAFFSAMSSLPGQSVDEPVAIRREPVDKPAIPKPSPSGVKTGETGVPLAKGRGEPVAGGTDVDAAEVEESASMGIEKMFPVGRTFFGVRIPSYTGDHLDSVVLSEVMKRVDEEHVDMEQLVIQMYTDGQPDAKIVMDGAIYDLEENKLTSRRTPPEILHSQFKMVGDKMIFDRETRVGHMTGNVKMTIFNVDSFLSESEMIGLAGE